MHHPGSDTTYKVGDKVRWKYGTRLVGVVMEVFVYPNDKGHVRYTVRVPMEAEPIIMILREDEIEKA
jgi:hypothetical protein